MINTLDNYCNDLAERIISESFLDKKELSLKIAITMSIIFNELLKSQIAKKEEERNRMWRMQEFEVKDGKERQFIQQQLTIVNSEIKKLKKALHTIQDFDEYKQLQKFVSERFGEKVLNDFYEQKNKKGGYYPT